MVLTVAKALVPRMSKIETPAIGVAYEVVGALNVALAVVALADVLSLDASSPLGTAGYTLGRPSPSRVAVRPRAPTRSTSSSRSRCTTPTPTLTARRRPARVGEGAATVQSPPPPSSSSSASRKRSSLGARVVGMGLPRRSCRSRCLPTPLAAPPIR